MGITVKFWGVRGSVATPGPSTVRYGGNTSCIEVRCDDRLVIIDMGTGMREMGLSLLGKGPVDADIFITHTHWDHIQGFPFFVPAFIPGNKFRIRGPVNSIGEKLKDILSNQMHYTYFPIPLGHLSSNILFEELKEGVYDFDGIKVTTQYLNHPILVLGYRIEYKDKVFVTEYDTEPYSNIFKPKVGGGEEKKAADDDEDDLLWGNSDDEAVQEEAEQACADMNRKVVEFARDADMIVFDSQYTTEEYKTKVGWGHSTIDIAVDVAEKANAKKLALFHHEPTRNDDALAKLEAYAQEEMVKRGRTDIEVFAAMERKEYVL